MRKAILLLTALSLHQLALAGSLTPTTINSPKTANNASSKNSNLSQDKNSYDVAPVAEKNHNEISEGRDEKEEMVQEEEQDASEPEGPIPCTCGVFLSGQFKKGSKKQPKGLPVLTQEMDTPFLNNAFGNRQCINKCLEVIVKHLPKSNDIICATVDRDEVYREKAYLFVKNHSDKWLPTNLSAGREFCCKENLPYKCNNK